MQKPEVKIIHSQETTATSINIDLSNPEIYELMSKYNIHSQNQSANNFSSNQINQIYDPYKDLTFDELIALEKQKDKAEKQRRETEKMKEINKPTPYSFDRNSVRYHGSNLKTIDDMGIGIEVKVVSNMDINKGYGY